MQKEISRATREKKFKFLIYKDSSMCPQSSKAFASRRTMTVAKKGQRD